MLAATPTLGIIPLRKKRARQRITFNDSGAARLRVANERAPGVPALVRQLPLFSVDTETEETK
jgi:hypothetical protein